MGSAHFQQQTPQQIPSSPMAFGGGMGSAPPQQQPPQYQPSNQMAFSGMGSATSINPSSSSTTEFSGMGSAPRQKQQSSDPFGGVDIMQSSGSVSSTSNYDAFASLSGGSTITSQSNGLLNGGAPQNVGVKSQGGGADLFAGLSSFGAMGVSSKDSKEKPASTNDWGDFQ
jgi:hypothetical protein